MALGLLTTLAVIVALWAAREMLRRRVVFVLGRRGHELAPGILLSLWLCGLLLGELTGSVTGMAIVAALVMAALALFSRRRFALLRRRHRIWTRLDWFTFLYVSAIFWFINLWDFVCHRAIVARYLLGNIPPTALNDPRLPLTYHSIYDAMAAVVMRAFPVGLQLGLALPSILCLAVTLANLRTITRLVFSSPAVAQLARVLFVWGFGPTFVVFFFAGSHQIDDLHGQTAQAFVNVILRRPAGLGLALLTIALALILPCYRAHRATSRFALEGATRRLLFLLPVAFLFPQTAEEGTFFFGLLLVPLLVTRRLRWPLVGALVAAVALGAARSGVLVSALMGYHAMAVPKPHFSWPPTLPDWKNAYMYDGASLGSREALTFFTLELGPVFFASLILALWRGGARRRLLSAIFLAGMAVALLVKPSGWPKSDLDRFVFYGTPFVFMLSAAFVEGLEARSRSRHKRSRSMVAMAVLAFVVCGPSVAWPTWNAGKQLRDEFQHHDIGGDLARNLAAVGPREPILTTVDRVDELVMVGFTVIAPFASNDVGSFTRNQFDSYVRLNRGRAVWLFLPAGDPRTNGHRIEGRDRGYVLVRVRTQIPQTVTNRP